jgi:hypothetical protein
MLRLSLPRVSILAGLTVASWAQMAPPVREIPLYPGVAPGSENWRYSERSAGTADQPQAQNIVRPVLLYYAAEKANAPSQLQFRDILRRDLPQRGIAAPSRVVAVHGR